MKTQQKQQLQYTTRIKIESLEGGGKHIFVPCIIEGIHVIMLIDTGCSNTVFDRSSKLFSDIRMHDIKGTNKNFSLNASIDDVKVGKIKDFAIGKFTTDLNRAVFISLDHINTLYKAMIGCSITGIIGSDFLKKYKAVIDFGAGKMTLKKVEKI